jgi:uncharacterized protein
MGYFWKQSLAETEARRFTMQKLASMIVLIVMTLVLGQGSVQGSVQGSGQSSSLNRKDFTVQLGNFSAKGQITYPAGKAGPFPTVLLIHGSTPMDMNATIQSGDQVASRIFLQLAETLSAQGFAVVRYNKRFVSAPGQVDTAAFYKLRLQDFLADARSVIEMARRDPLLDSRLFVYGWSEGSVIAAQIALTDPNVRGLIVQGPVVHSFSNTFNQQVRRVALPYLQRFALEGRLDLTRAQQATRGAAGLLARSMAYYLFDPNSNQSKLNPFMDKNKDGWLDLKTEIQPVWEYVFQDSPATLGLYSSALGLPTLLEVAPKLSVPILMLQGENDANTYADGARDLESALSKHPDRTLKLYSGLGHSLGAAKDVIDDRFRPMEAKPLEDVSNWLQQHSQ